MLKKIIFVTTIISLCLLVILLNVTAPSWAGPFGILAIFVFAYLSSLGLVTYFFYWASKAISYFSKSFITIKPILTLDFKRSYYFATVFAAVPIILMGLQSVGSIGIYESLLLVLFLVIGCVYVSKRTN